MNLLTKIILSIINKKMKKTKPIFAPKNFNLYNFPGGQTEKNPSPLNKPITSFNTLPPPSKENTFIPQFEEQRSIPNVDINVMKLEEFIPKQFNQ